MRIRKYIINSLVAFDQWINTLIGGQPDDTISARAGRGRKNGKFVWIQLANLLDWIEPGHTFGAIQHDIERAKDIEKIDAKN